jgi:2,4-dienoyl-CoA reductase-like NADH-dependent reductase (Old Yellow Enzyme family)
MTQERGNRLIKTGLADSIAFGRPYITNPDLPERFSRLPYSQRSQLADGLCIRANYIDDPAHNLNPTIVGMSDRIFL